MLDYISAENIAIEARVFPDPSTRSAFWKWNGIQSENILQVRREKRERERTAQLEPKPEFRIRCQRLGHRG
jgi:hypothetical protein